MKYYLLHLPVNEPPALHGPLMTQVSVGLRQEDIEGDIAFSEYDQLICLAVTGHGEIVRAEFREFQGVDDESVRTTLDVPKLEVVKHNDRTISS